jgi:Family of unknown function (DUF6941)
VSIPPVARGLHLCEQVIIDPGTSNVSLIRCFTRKHVPRFPTPPVRFALYATLTGGLGHVKMRVMLSRLEDNRLVYSRDLPVTFQDRVREVRFILHLSDVVFPDPGQYVIELLADGEWTAQTVIEVTT